MPARAPRVALVSMPWTTLTEPSLGLGILKATLDDAGIPCRVHHANLQLLRHLRASTYFAIANAFALNDFLFSGDLDPSVTSRQRGLLRRKADELLGMSILDPVEVGGVDGVVARLLEFRRDIVPAWLGEITAQIVAGEPTLVGLTCMFDQTIASVALARRLRAARPEALLVLGGYAVRDPTGPMLMEAFPWLDAICLGEGEPTIAALADASVGQVPLSAVPGLAIRDDAGGVVRTETAPLVRLDDVPTPSYSDFYADLREMSERDRIDVAVGKLPVENSRGCWWGAVSHCVFCGIHDEDLRFRQRSADVVLRTLDELHERHGVKGFRFADYILPRGYFTDLLPALREAGAIYDITAEVKANLSLRQLVALRDAGFTEVQPGIESFSSDALKAMAKGTSMLRNLQTLVLGRSLGIVIHYNLLYGFTSDVSEDYERMCALLPLLTHLDPPSTRLEVQVTRYAPMQTDPDRFDMLAATHDPSYDLIFSAEYLASSGFALDDYCYYYARPYQNAPRLQRLYAQIDRLVDAWRANQRERPVELRWDGTDSVIDTRATSAGVTHRLTETEASVLRACVTITSESRMADQLDLSVNELTEVLRGLATRGLLVREGGRALSLVLADATELTLRAREFGGADEPAALLPLVEV